MIGTAIITQHTLLSVQPKMLYAGGERERAAKARIWGGDGEEEEEGVHGLTSPIELHMCECSWPNWLCGIGMC